MISYTSLSDYSTDKQNAVSYLEAPLDKTLEVMRVHPVRTQLFATGGKDSDLKIYDINAINAPSLADQQVKNGTKYEKSKAQNKGLLFQAKNVRQL